MRNKIMGWRDVPANAASDIINFGLNRSGLEGSLHIQIQCNGPYTHLPSASQIHTAAASFPASLGLDLYVADETNDCPGAFAALKSVGTIVHSANRQVRTMVTINAVDSNLLGAIDHWVLLDSVQQWPALPFTRGRDLSSYTSCNVGFRKPPEWMV